LLFNSYQFLIFFPIVVFIYLICPKKLRYLWLLVSSFYFYMSWSVKYFFLMLLSIFITYISGLALDAINSSDSKAVFRKKLVVFESVFMNLSILFFFKYSNFFFETISNIFSSFNIQLIDNPFTFVLPVGISFYTFQALSYTIDVYRGDTKAEKNFFKYALFVSFFPQLVAGPIERSKDLLTQIEKTHEIKIWDFERIKSGLILMLWGFFLKVVIADRAAILADNVFNNIYNYGSFELIIGAIIFAFQVYCDFAGYSTIALGSAKVMGFNLTENFNAPYLSRSIKEFWQRWHITLGKWVKDYIYFPLGGSRCSKPRKYLNLFTAFFLMGLWHGANFTYIIACSLQGIYQILGEILRPIKDKINAKLNTKTESFSYILAQILITFSFNLSFCILVRSQTVTDAFNYTKRIFTEQNPWVLFDGTLYTLGLDRAEFDVLIVSLIVLLIVDLIKYIKKQRIDEFLNNQCIWFRWTALFALIFSIIIFGMYGPEYNAINFIYFQF